MMLVRTSRLFFFFPFLCCPFARSSHQTDNSYLIVCVSIGCFSRIYRVCCPIFFFLIAMTENNKPFSVVFLFFSVCVSLHDNDISYIRERFGPLVRSHLNYISHSTKHFRVCLRFFFPPNLISILIAVFSRSGIGIGERRKPTTTIFCCSSSSSSYFLIIHFFFLVVCVCLFLFIWERIFRWNNCQIFRLADRMKISNEKFQKRGKTNDFLHNYK